MSNINEDRVTPLLPCPFCGGENIRIRYDRDDPEYTFAQCDTCETQGPVVVSSIPDTKDRAIARWNRRASPPVLSEEQRGAILGGAEALVELHEMSTHAPQYTLKVTDEAALLRYAALLRAMAQRGK